MALNIVFLDGYSLGENSLESIEKLGNLTVYHTTQPNEVVQRSMDAQIIITNKVKILKPEMDALPNLKLICVAATGVNNVDVEYAKQRGIEVKNVPAYSTQSVTEATFAMVLALLRQISYYDQYVKSGSYSTSGKCFNLDRKISEIAGKKWGIIGMGNIGQRVAQIAELFGAEVQYYSTSGGNLSQPYKSVGFDELLTSSDIITIHAPLNPKTQNLISKRELGLIKETSILVNVGRGGIVDEAALATALNENAIGGAALDVFVNEPLESSSELLSLVDSYKFIAAPHSGWSSSEAITKLVSVIVSNIQGFLAKGE